MKLSASSAGFPCSVMTVSTPGVRRMRDQSETVARANRYPGKSGSSTSFQRSLQRWRSLTTGSQDEKPSSSIRLATFFSARDSAQMTNQAPGSTTELWAVWIMGTRVHGQSQQRDEPGELR